MAHTFTNLLSHVIFSTKGREPLITPDLRGEMPAYLGGIVRNLKGKLIEAHARPDHVHCLLSLPAAVAVAEVIRVMKSNSSKWVRETRRHAPFAWQIGYGAFSVSYSSVPKVLQYIRNQDEHHRKTTFQGEFIAFLKRHGITYDEQYIWE